MKKKNRNKESFFLALVRECLPEANNISDKNEYMSDRSFAILLIMVAVLFGLIAALDHVLLR
ncbi:MAG: hypothetical protein ABSB78_03170 [Bacteroidota bacterium]